MLRGPVSLFHPFRSLHLYFLTYLIRIKIRLFNSFQSNFIHIRSEMFRRNLEGLMINTTWKSKLLKFAGSTLLGVSVLAMPMQAGAEVSTAPGSSVAATAPQAAPGTNIQLAQWGPPPPRWGRPPPPRWQRPPPPRWHRPPPPYYGPRYGAPPPRYRRSGSHVNWCLNRYRSYNPRTDQYLGYDGYYHYCRSPYR